MDKGADASPKMISRITLQRLIVCWAAVCPIAVAGGCHQVPLEEDVTARSTAPQLLPNPLPLPPVDRDFLWDQLTDTVDDYFEIAHEQRLQMVGTVLMEGRMETHPMTGATVVERWRRDSTPGFERWLATFQSVRRKSEVRIFPVHDGYQVQVHVYKELEELNQPENSSVAMVTQRHDGTLVRPGDPSRIGPVTLGWIPIGRDVSLEQEILSQLQARVIDAGDFAPEVRIPHHLPQ
jgi:hypothetical protein